MRPIGIVRSPHRERHGTPRQAVLHAKPELRPSEETVLELSPDILTPHATEDLQGFEYLWVLSWMHLNQARPCPRGTSHSWCTHSVQVKCRPRSSSNDPRGPARASASPQQRPTQHACRHLDEALLGPA